MSARVNYRSFEDWMGERKMEMLLAYLLAVLVLVVWY